MVVQKCSHIKRVCPGADLGRLLRALLLLELLVLSGPDLAAQRSPFDSAWTSEASQIREKVDLFTDRSLYVCEEPIRFSTRISVDGPSGSGPWSTVLYVELVSVDGYYLARGKYPVRNGLSQGEIRIPGGLLTGQYFLRCYTRWMRNRGPASFTYVPLRIINPRRSELYEPSSQEKAQSLLPDRAGPDRTLEFMIRSSACDRGDSIVLGLNLPPGQGPDSISGCLTVIPVSLAPPSGPYALQDQRDYFQVEFLPDRTGPSLSGTVQSRNGTGDGISPAVIHLTLMNDASGYLVCRSDPGGKFTVELPFRNGNYEIFVQPEGPDHEEVEVRIDQDFDPRQIHFKTSPFTLTEDEMKWAAIMSRNIQLSGIYGHSELRVSLDSAGEAHRFYGTPTRSVDLDEYVLLPTLREVFLNFVPGVTPRSRKGRTTLMIESENPSLSLYESLVMVDQVPVLNIEEFMSLPPVKIRQIDVIEDVYVKGDLRYGGIINLVSRDQDMAGIDLPDHSFFIDYMAMYPETLTYSESGSPDDQIPDMRNTLLWLPDLKLQMDAPASISFQASDYPSDYMILFRGTDRQGGSVRAETVITVR